MSLAFVSLCFHISLYYVLTVISRVLLSALAPGTGVAVYAGLVGALLLCVILVLCVGVLAYRRRCRHLHGDITDSSSALTAAFHPGNYKPPRQGRFTHTKVSTHSHTMCHCDYFNICLNFTHLHRNMSSHCYLYQLINLFSLNHYPPRLVNSQICTAFYTLNICHGTPSLVLAIKY